MLTSRAVTASRLNKHLSKWHEAGVTVLTLPLPAQVGLFDKFEGDEFALFKKQADALREDFAFRYTDSASVLGEPALTAPAVRLFKAFDDGLADLAKEVSEGGNAG